MLRCLLLLAVVLKLYKVWKAHVQSSERHVAIGNSRRLSKRSRDELLTDCCCVS
jgi:hypothetical protein